jgi:hypothetical protein
MSSRTQSDSRRAAQRLVQHGPTTAHMVDRGSARSSGSVAHLVGANQQAWARPLCRKPVISIPQRAFSKRQASASDAPVELVAKLHQALNPFVQKLLPVSRQTPPVRSSQGAIGGNSLKVFLNRRQRYARALRNPYHRDTSQRRARIAPLIPPGPPSLDQSLRLIKVDRGYGDAAATSQFSDSQLGALGF